MAVNSENGPYASFLLSRNVNIKSRWRMDKKTIAINMPIMNFLFGNWVASKTKSASELRVRYRHNVALPAIIPAGGFFVRKRSLTHHCNNRVWRDLRPISLDKLEATMRQVAYRSRVRSVGPDRSVRMPYASVADRISLCPIATPPVHAGEC